MQNITSKMQLQASDTGFHFKVTLKSICAETGDCTFEVVTDMNVFNRAQEAIVGESCHVFDACVDAIDEIVIEREENGEFTDEMTVAEANISLEIRD